VDEFESLSHSKWECKYHVVFIPKFRRKVLYGELRKHLGEVFRKLAEQRDEIYIKNQEKEDQRLDQLNLWR
jgi:putative transposase